MQRITMRAFAVLLYLVLDTAMTWAMLSAGLSLVVLDWAFIHATPLGRGLWLLFWVWEVRSTVPLAIASADRRMSKTADAQPPATA